MDDVCRDLLSGGLELDDGFECLRHGLH
jgi:hypothetical protein